MIYIFINKVRLSFDQIHLLIHNLLRENRRIYPYNENKKLYRYSDLFFYFEFELSYA